MELNPGQIINNRFELLEKIGEGGMAIVFKAHDTQNDMDVAIKFLKPNITSSYIEDRIRFKREVEVISKFNHPNIIKLYGTGEYNNVPYIVMELLEGENLYWLLERGRIYNADEAINLIKQIAEALTYVHTRGIIHRDLKPGNIMIEKQTGKVKLLDFGLALIMELSQLKEEREIIGTFMYMSPEATGIIDKPIDERSDLYSLGIIFYKLLTGELPFKGKRTSEILHQQVAIMPPRPSRINLDVPKVLEDIVMKLLEKEPELRYQSVRGLLYDIQRYEKGEREFIIGEKDQKIKLTYRPRLIGRQQEIHKIKGLFDRAMNSAGRVCLVAGEAGIGKSRLVEEIKGYVYEQKGLFFTGRCFDQENKIPYQPFKDIIDEYIRRVKRLEKREQEEERKRVKEVLGELGRVIIRLNPNIIDILGQMPELVPLKEPEREHKRFLMVCAKFFCSLAEKKRGIILFIDDLQWADEGSLNLIEEISKIIDNSNLLLIGTYRDNEITEEHSLNRIKKEAKESKYALEEISLGLFNYERMRKLTAEVLGEREEKAERITKYIMEKTKGNPFFAITLLRELVEGKTIVWKEGYWQEDWEKIEKLPVSANIVDMILLRIKELPQEEDKLLRIGSVIGRKFEVDMLYDLMEEEKEKIIGLVDNAINGQLLEKSKDRGKVIFVHDRIKDAFYSRMGKEEKRNYHLKIGRVIEEGNKGREEVVIFDLAHHYIEAEDRNKALMYALPAAERARGNYANEEAIKYYKVVIRILEGKTDQRWMRAKDGLAEVYLTVGKNDEAINICEDILPLKKITLEKLSTYKKMGMAYFKKGDWHRCENTLAKGLELLGEKVPRVKKEVTISLMKELFVHVLQNAFPRLFMHKGKSVRPEDKEVIWVYLPLGWMYILSNVLKSIRVILRILNLSQRRIGKSRELGLSTGGYAGLCMAIPLFKRAIRYHQKALKMKEELKDEWGIAQSLQIMGYCYQWKGDYGKSVEIFQKSKERFQAIGDMWELGMVVQALGVIYYYKGDYPKSMDFTSQYLELSQKIKDDQGISSAEGTISAIYTDKGNFEKAEEWIKKSLALSEEKGIDIVTCTSYIYYGYLNLERGKYEEAIRYLEKARKLHEEIGFLKDYVVYLYPHLADAYINQFTVYSLQFTVKDKRQKLKKIGSACKNALKKTRQWRSHYGKALRVTAKYYGLAGKRRKAERYFLKGIEQTKRIGRKFELAKGYYEYGNFFESLNQKKEAIYNWREAYNIFKQIGAEVYIKRCMDLLGYKQPEEKEAIREETPRPRERLKIEREMTTVLETSRYLSSILELDELLEKIIDKAIQLVGAERGILLLYPEQEEEERKLEVRVVRNAKESELEEEAFSTSRSIISKVEKQRNLLIIEDATLDSEFKKEVSVVKYGLKSVLCLPIMGREDMLGIIYLDNRLVSGLFTEEDLRVLELIARQAGVSIENAILYKRAITDGLTGLYNHNFFENYLIKIVSQMNRYNKKLSLLMIDIDHFKNLNDQYGHRAGDLVLKSVSDILKKNVRERDLVARYGGEEFVIVLPETGLESAKTLAEKLRETIEENKILYKIEDNPTELKVTLSIGVAELKKGQGRIELIEESDKALYKAKEGGRNRVEM